MGKRVVDCRRKAVVTKDYPVMYIPYGLIEDSR